MRKLICLFFVMFITLTTLTSCSTDSEDNTSKNYSINNKYDYSAIELEVLDLINEYRVSKGLNSLQIINHISNVSESHDNYMISVNMLTHALFAQREANLKSTLEAETVGENLAYNFSSAASVLNAWLESPSHKETIEGSYTHFGISVRLDSEGNKYFTNIFIRK